MRNKKMVSSLVVLMGVCLVGAFFFRDIFMTQTGDDHKNITDMESAYQADGEIAQALERMKSSQEKATVITQSNSSQRQIALTFDGLGDRTHMQQILDLLKKYNAQATFFVDGMQTAEDPQTVINIKNAGYQVGNYTLTGMAKMESLPVERMVRDFGRSQKIIKVTTDQGPTLLKCNDTNYTDQLLQVAKASGFDSVVKSSVFLNAKQINSLTAAEQFVGTIKPGSIVSVKLKTNGEAIVNEQERTDLKPAIDKQPGLKVLPQEIDLGEKEIIDGVENFLIALNKANYTTAYVGKDSTNNTISQPAKATFLEDRIKYSKEENETSLLAQITSLLQGQISDLFTLSTAYAAESETNKATEIKIISTTEPALSYTFGGLAKEAVVDDMLARLNVLGIKGTFFIAEVEMKKYPLVVHKIIDDGHEIGLAIRPKDGETLDETKNDIIRGRKILHEQFGVDTNLVKQPYGIVTDTTKQAVFSLDCKLISQSINVVQSKHKDYTSADQVMAEIFGKSVFSLERGQIVHFRMDFYTKDGLIGDLMETIKQRKVDNIAYAMSFDNPGNNPANNSQYKIKPVGQILNNTKFTYQYPVNSDTIPASLKNDGPRITIDEHNFLAETSKRYIGNMDVTYEDRMLGFSKMDVRRLDTSGRIHTEDNVIFLTFDDWGTDAAVNKILYVLHKHNVPGTFFVLTNNVLNNPNLLRSIAVQGNNIGGHSDKHKPMVVRDPKTGRLVKTQDDTEYTKELATSYQKLREVIGDVTINGKTALTRFFRPPTLAISKMGAEDLFETGYEYIISGSWSTYDYKAQNVTQLVETIKDGVYTKNGTVNKGSILVMHMGDGVLYTPMALDILLTANDAKKDSDPSKFKVGRLSDYITEGYSQIDRKKHYL